MRRLARLKRSSSATYYRQCERNVPFQALTSAAIFVKKCYLCHRHNYCLIRFQTNRLWQAFPSSFRRLRRPLVVSFLHCSDSLRKCIRLQAKHTGHKIAHAHTRSNLPLIKVLHVLRLCGECCLRLYHSATLPAAHKLRLHAKQFTAFYCIDIIRIKCVRCTHTHTYASLYTMLVTWMWFISIFNRMENVTCQ